MPKWKSVEPHVEMDIDVKLIIINCTLILSNKEDGGGGLLQYIY